MSEGKRYWAQQKISGSKEDHLHHHPGRTGGWRKRKRNGREVQAVIEEHEEPGNLMRSSGENSGLSIFSSRRGGFALLAVRTMMEGI